MEYDLDWVRLEYGRGKRMKYLFFWGHQPMPDGGIGKSCLSQWWNAAFELDGEQYLNAEQYMMAEKARLFQDEDIRHQILKSKHPKQMKALGRMVKGFQEDVWKQGCRNIVKQGNLAKFSQHKELLDYLIQTQQRILVEASPMDRIWGIGLAAGSAQIENPLSWKGENLLGFVLMEVRDDLMQSGI